MACNTIRLQWEFQLSQTHQDQEIHSILVKMDLKFRPQSSPPCYLCKPHYQQMYSLSLSHCLMLSQCICLHRQLTMGCPFLEELMQGNRFPTTWPLPDHKEMLASAKMIPPSLP